MVWCRNLHITIGATLTLTTINSGRGPVRRPALT
jgi:hypothetical protein